MNEIAINTKLKLNTKKSTAATNDIEVHKTATVFSCKALGAIEMNIIPGNRINKYKIGNRLEKETLIKIVKSNNKEEYKDGSIFIKIDENDIIDLVSTIEGEYENISTEKTYRQIIEEGSDLIYDEFDQIFYLKNINGICLENDYKNLSFYELIDCKIQYITVYKIESEVEQDREDFDLINKDNLNEFIENSKDSESFLKTKIKNLKKK